MAQGSVELLPQNPQSPSSFMHGPALPRGLYPSVCWIFNLPLVLPSHSSLSPSLPSPRQGVSNISLAASLLPSKLCTLRYTAQAFHGKCGFKVQWIQNQIHCTLFAKRPEPQIERRFTTTWHCRVKYKHTVDDNLHQCRTMPSLSEAVELKSCSERWCKGRESLGDSLLSPFRRI